MLSPLMISQAKEKYVLQAMDVSASWIFSDQGKRVMEGKGKHKQSHYLRMIILDIPLMLSPITC